MWWLGQAGFALKSQRGTILYVDPYLSDVVERVVGFKRLSLAPIDTADVRADWVVSTHEHLDHLDTEALPVIAQHNAACRFAGPASCEPEYNNMGIEKERRLLLQADQTYSLDDVRMTTAQADHGDLSPEALSLMMDFSSVRILFTGDTAFRPDLLEPLDASGLDVLVPCINGRFGNMDAAEAAMLTRTLRPRLAVPCHFWMFKEQNGDPETFVVKCTQYCQETRVELLTPGRGLLIGPETVDSIGVG